MASNNKTIRWGIIGAGSIAHCFAGDMHHVEGAELLAVGSRTRENAEAFGAKFRIPRRYASYEELLADPDVDVVYIASPHTQHHPHTLMCLNAGKHVVCEKPLAVNTAQAEEMIALAKAKGLFLMEGMWTLCFPAIKQAMKLISDDAIGAPRVVRSDFSFYEEFNPLSRLFDPVFAGGSLLDVGIYPLTVAQAVFGAAPKRIQSHVRFAPSGVDEEMVALLEYPGGAHAEISSSLQMNLPVTAMIAGEKGVIEFPDPFFRPSRIVVRKGGTVEEINFEFPGHGFHYEAQEVTRCIQAGKTQSDSVPWEQSLGRMRIMDALRTQWGLRYPADK